ncbi:CoA-binding protein [Candidatus Woesearchaeota archaeon]|nr:CoA-binding protein [Candidatus Woesearchaeota archaeon]
MKLDTFFNPKSVAVLGVSRNPNKVGHVIFRNIVDAKWKGMLYPVNPNAEIVLNFSCFKSVLEIRQPVDLAVIAVPANFVLKAVDECGRKGIKHVVMITSGFQEVGNLALQNKLLALLKKYNIAVVGPNCLGVFDAYSKIDTLFLPRYRLSRPHPGGISFVCQSGAVGSAILDLATTEHYGFSKFISYGNALNVDEADYIEYLGKDPATRVICLYVEGVKDGPKFLRVCKEVSRAKPIIALKAGVSAAGAKATMSHTGALAGAAEIYDGVFKQANIIRAHSLEEMFNYARALEKGILPKGPNVAVITNGGGYGILSTDAVIMNGLQMAAFSPDAEKAIAAVLPPIVKVHNPLDLAGDATTERYRVALEAVLADKNVDMLLVIVLYQTPLITTDIVDIIIELNDLKKKPICVVSTGGEFTEVLKKSLEQNGVPCYTFPEQAVGALRQLYTYNAKNHRR